jgi:hypothetical protein
LLRTVAQYASAPELVNAEEFILEQIYSVTGGNPLALWLVAGQAHGIPLRTFVQGLVDHCPHGSKGYELYDYLYRRSWNLLSPSARIVLFGMHRSSAGVDYNLLYKLSRFDRTMFESALEELQNRMLLQFDGYLYTIHRLTHTFLRAGVVEWWK